MTYLFHEWLNFIEQMPCLFIILILAQTVRFIPYIIPLKKILFIFFGIIFILSNILLYQMRVSPKETEMVTGHSIWLTYWMSRHPHTCWPLIFLHGHLIILCMFCSRRIVYISLQNKNLISCKLCVILLDTSSNAQNCVRKPLLEIFMIWEIFLIGNCYLMFSLPPTYQKGGN